MILLYRFRFFGKNPIFPNGWFPQETNQSADAGKNAPTLKDLGPKDAPGPKDLGKRLGTRLAGLVRKIALLAHHLPKVSEPSRGQKNHTFRDFRHHAGVLRGKKRGKHVDIGYCELKFAPVCQNTPISGFLRICCLRHAGGGK